MNRNTKYHLAVLPTVFLLLLGCQNRPFTRAERTRKHGEIVVLLIKAELLDSEGNSRAAERKVERAKALWQETYFERMPEGRCGGVPTFSQMREQARDVIRKAAENQKNEESNKTSPADR